MRKSKGLFYFGFCIIFMFFAENIAAQNIVNKIGGTGENDEFQVTDSNDNVKFTVQGDGKIGIGTSTPQGVVEIVSTTEGVLIPRMTLAQRNSISNPATGLLIYQTDNGPDFHYYNGTIWNCLDPQNTFGGMGFSDQTLTITITTQDTWYQITGLAESYRCNNITMSNDELVIGSGYSGDYQAWVSVSFIGSNNDDLIEITLAVAGTIDATRGKKMIREITNSGKVKGGSFCGYYHIHSGSTNGITIWVRNTASGGHSIEMVDVRVNLTRVRDCLE